MSEPAPAATPPGPRADRLARLRRLMAEAGLDAVALVPGPNMVYFTGASFALSERPVIALLPILGRPIVLLPALEAMKLDALPFPTRPHPYGDEEGPEPALGRAMADLGRLLAEAREDGRYRPDRADGRRPAAWLGVEGRRMRFLELDAMARSGKPPRIFAADEVFAELRMRKDEAEVAAMREATHIAEAALEATLPFIRPGRTEREVAAELTVQLLRHGSDPDLPFSPIVAAGPNGASPHAAPTDRPLAPGDLVIVDWGAAAGGYFSDLTRTFALGGAPIAPELAAAYEAVRLANEAGRAAARPGATAEAVDAAARGVIEAAGLGERFLHRTGHGLGLEVHEEPDIKAGSRVRLAAGMTFTVEPGVYLPGLGGVRIEDDVVIGAGGSESLSSWPREIMTLE